MGRKTSFYLADNAARVFGHFAVAYDGESKAVNAALLCLDTIYRHERKLFAEVFTQGEIDLMLNNAMSAYYDPQNTLGAILHQTEDDAPEQFDYFDVDRQALIAKLKRLTISQEYALVDMLMEMRAKISNA